MDGEERLKSRRWKPGLSDASLPREGHPSHCLQGSRSSGAGGLPFGSVGETVEHLCTLAYWVFSEKGETLPPLYSYPELPPLLLCALLSLVFFYSITPVPS